MVTIVIWVIVNLADTTRSMIQCVPSVSYLTVESEDPVTMTLSSYCRHNTEPVWPVSIFRHSRDCLSQICEESGQEWEEEEDRGGHRERWRISGCEKVADLGHVKNGLFSQQRSCPISPLLSVYVRAIQALPWVCISLLQNNKKTNPLFSSPPLHHLLLFSQARQISGTHNGFGSWALLSHNSLVFCLSVCWVSSAPQTIRW